MLFGKLHSAVIIDLMHSVLLLELNVFVRCLFITHEVKKNTKWDFILNTAKWFSLKHFYILNTAAQNAKTVLNLQIKSL